MTDAAATTLDGLPALSLPPLPPEPARAAFPWLASAAPVGGAVAIWAITGSAVSLAFAALGPLVAVASVLDARRTARRLGRKQARDRATAIGRLRSEVARRHGIERAAAWRATPSARSLGAHAAPAWSPRPPDSIVIGSGERASRVSVDGAPGADPEALRLVAEAARLADAPIAVHAVGGVGFVGSSALARACARAAVVQLAEATDPARSRIVGPDAAWGWLDGLPHRATGPGVALVRVVDAGAESRAPDSATPPVGPDAFDPERTDVGAEIMLAVAPDAAALPPGLRTVVEVRAPRQALVRRTGDAPHAVVPELLSEAEARAVAAGHARSAARAGIAPAAALVASVAFADLPLTAAPPADRSSLAAPIGVGAAGPLTVDLVTGPHAMVAGTSGSGKSELLVTWIAAMAARYAPDRVAFLLVDFKGGAAFEPVRALPHVAGLVTDLDEDEAARAVESIRAELRHRERVLAAEGVRGIAELPGAVTLPRLVVVVDEFQAMIERFDELGSVIADVAARGRSLGVHLVLAAQRPNGVVREQVSANCGIRVSLRVLDRADSVAVIGVDRACRLDAAHPGRALVDAGDGRVLELQAALADPEAIAAIAARHAHTAPPRRPWLDPLPSRIGLDDAGSVLVPAVADDACAPEASARLLLGVVDEPDAQRRSAATWTPQVDGALVVLGAPGSGRTALLEALATQVVRRHGESAVLRLEGARSAVWDALQTLREGVTARRGALATAPEPRLIVVDDLDLRFAGWPDAYRVAAFDAIEGLMRSCRGAGPAVALSAGRIASLGPGIRDAATTQVLLRHPSRADLVHAGGEGRHHRAEAPPGAGQWRARAAQFLHAARATVPATRVEAAPLRLDGAAVVAVASARPAADAEAIGRAAPALEVVRLADGPDAARRAQEAMEPRGSGDARIAIVGDAEAWSANWALAAAVRARADVVVHGGQAELRALARDAGLAPLLDEDRDQCWRIGNGMTTERATWPSV